MKAQNNFRIFLSSTFGDFHAERAALQERVWPALTQYCRARGASFQVVDLRWGVSESAGLEHETMKICLDEIAHCQRLSPRPNFVVLVGDRYGWRPTPSAVPAADFERILDHDQPDEAAQELLRRWYWRDDNAVPAEYVLQPRRGKYARDVVAWGGIERQLLRCLRTAAMALNLPPDHYFYSATHLEIIHGALDQCCVPDAADHVLACFRRLEELPEDRAGLQAAGRFLDLTADGERDVEAGSYLEQLRTDLHARLAGNGRVYEHTARWTGVEPSPITLDHLDSLCQEVEAGLRALLDRELAQRAELEVIDQERDAHQAFAEERGAVFVGREEPLAAIAGYLAGNDEPSQSGAPLLVHGPGGVGKSALLARAWLQALPESPDTVRMARFIGATPGSVDVRFLLETLCRELARAYGQDETLPEGGFKKLIETFSERLGFASADRPLWLLIDAVDQLVEHGGEAPYAWLPQRLPPAVRLVVSVLDGAAGAAVRQRLPEAVPLPVLPVGEREAKAMLDARLATATPTQPSRQLTLDQRRMVLAGLRGSGLPLWLTVAITVARRWRSYDSARALAADMTALLEQRLLAGLEKRHGRWLVRRAISYLLVSRYGLSDEELREALWRDPDCRAEFEARKNPDQPEVHALPPVIWSRLYFELEAYLRVRLAQGAPCHGFFHRKIGESLRTLCLSADQAPVRHAHLAACWAAQGYRDAARRPQPRTLAEWPWQQIQASLGVALEVTLTDFDFAMAKAEAGLTEDLVADYRSALSVLAPPSHTFRLWENFFRSRQHILRRAYGHWPAHKILLQLAVEHADESPVTQAAENWLEQGYCDWVWLRNPQRVNEAQINPCTVLLEGEEIKGVEQLPDGRLLSWGAKLRIWDLETEQCIRILKGHTGLINGLQISTDGRILSWSMDKTLRMWDGLRALELSVLAGHADGIGGAHLLTDGRILSWCHHGCDSQDFAPRLWDIATGKCLAVLEGHKSQIKGIRELANGQLLSWVHDNSLRLWDKISGALLATLIGHTDWVIDVKLLENGDILSWSYDNTLRLWNGNGINYGVMIGHTDWINGAVEIGSKRILSWAKDSTLRLWDTVNGKLLMVLNGHTEEVVGTTVLSDGKILSWSKDKTLQLWDGLNSTALAILAGHTEEVVGATALSDGKILSWSRDKTLRLWDWRGIPLIVLEGHTREVSGVKVLADGRFLSWSRDRTLRLWDNTSNAPLSMLAKHSDWVTGVIMLADRRVMSWSRDRTLRLWDGASGAPLAVLEGHTGTIKSAMVLTDGRILSWSMDRTLRLWDGASGAPLAVLEGHTDWVTDAITLVDNRILSWSKDKTLRLWDGANATPLLILEGHTEEIDGVIGLADGRILSWSRKNILCWNLASIQHTLPDENLGRLLFKGLLESVGPIEGYRELSLDRLITWSKENISLWDTKNYQPLAILSTNSLCLFNWTIQITKRNEPVIYFKNLVLLDTKTRSNLRSFIPLNFNESIKNIDNDHGIIAQDNGNKIMLKWSNNCVLIPFWQGETNIKTQLLLEDGTLIISLDSGHVFCLKLYRGNQRINLSDLVALSPQSPVPETSPGQIPD